MHPIPSQAGMVRELTSWRAMIVPVLYTTGINTKVYTALALGIPLVITSTAAAPFDLPANGSVALVADEAEAFGRAVESTIVSDTVWREQSAGSRRHWARLLNDDRAAADVKVRRLQAGRGEEEAGD